MFFKWQTGIMEEVKFTAITLIALIIFLITIFYTTSTMLEKKYQKATSLINQKKWLISGQVLNNMPYYKDVAVLKKYVQAKIEIEYENKNEPQIINYNIALSYLQDIPDDYQGNYKEEIITFKNKIIQKRNYHVQKNSSETNEINQSPYNGEEIQEVKMGNRLLYVDKEYLKPIFDLIPY